MSDTPIPRPSSLPPPKTATRALGRKPRMSRFLRVLITITAIVHVPFAIGVTEVARRLGVWSPPTIALGLYFAGRISRLMREGMSNVLHEGFVTTARAKGLSETAVLIKHSGGLY